MAASSERVVSVLLAILLAQFWAQPVRGQPLSSGVIRTCPPGWLVQGLHGGPGYYCTQDPCVQNPCGPGNTCTTIRGIFGPVANCTCNPPYTSGTVPEATGTGGASVCYLPGQDACNPSPCQNGGTCLYRQDSVGQPLIDGQGTKYAFQCDCGSSGHTGRICTDAFQDSPKVTATVNGVSGPLATALLGSMCNRNGIPPIPCLYADGAHFICCNGTSDCGPIGPDGNTPICPLAGYIPSPNDYPVPLPPLPTPPATSGDQGVCGSGAASAFPTRCWFNSDPQGRYVCCDSQGCDGFNNDNLTPHCKNNGYVPPNNGLAGSTPPSTPPSGDQGVCGSGAAASFPTRCWFNSDPQGRYVCCDNQGCDGFNADNLTPHCKNYGYVPPNNGLSGPATPPSSLPSGSQGVCGASGAVDFPTRCWFNNDPQHRYVCCDKDGCDGFNPPDFSFPRCKTNGYVPPGFGV